LLIEGEAIEVADKAPYRMSGILSIAEIGTLGGFTSTRLRLYLSEVKVESVVGIRSCRYAWKSHELRLSAAERIGMCRA